MAIAYTTKTAKNSAASGTSVAVTVPAGGFTAGNKLMCVFAVPDVSAFASAMTDTAGNPYTSRHTYSQVGQSVTLFEGDLTSGLSSGQSVTATIPDGGALMVYEFSGLLTGTSFDKQANATAVATTYSSGATAVTTQADELLFAITSVQTASATSAPDAPWTEIDENLWFAAQDVQIAYQVVAAAAAYTSTGTITASSGYMATIDTFKGAAAGADTGLAWIRA